MKVTAISPACAVTVWLLLVGSAAPAGDKNVVLFVTDDQGQDAGCYGNRVIKTPNLDRLAADGTRFTHAFCTTASCSPSRSVILTGLHNHANGQYGLEHNYHHFRGFEKNKSLPQFLKQAGYRTARIGKLHVGPEEVYKFDTVIPADPRSTVEMASRCKEFIAGDDRPFFLYFCPTDPHRGGGKVDDLPAKPDRFGNRAQGYPGVTAATYDPRDVIVPPFLPDSAACRAELAQYYQSVTRVDQGLGKLIEVLKETGKWDNTLFLYISDNGVPFPGAKTTVYEPGIRLPCIVRNPYLKKRGVVCDALVSWIDLTPTILDFAGALPKKAGFHGRSFLPVLDQEETKGWDETYASHTFHEVTMYYPMRVARTRRHKLIWNLAHGLPFPFASDLWESATWQDISRQGGDARYGKRTVKEYTHRSAFELYDLEKDPNEVHNLAKDPGHAKIFDELKAKLKEFQKRTSDPWLLKWERE